MIVSQNSTFECSIFRCFGIFDHVTLPCSGFSKQVKQKVTEPRLEVQTLEEEVSYTFVVRAETTDYGPPIRANVTTGPQDGSPSTPRAFTIGKTVSSVEMHWANSASGKGPILGYYIQSKRKGK